MNTQTESSYRSVVAIPAVVLPATPCQAPKVMRAVVYDVENPKADPLVREVSIPHRGPGQLLVHVEAASLTSLNRRRRIDETRNASWFGSSPVPAYGIAGHVVGYELESGFRPGDRVLGHVDHVGGEICAEFAICSEEHTAQVPEAMPMNEACTLPLAGTMALQAIRQDGKAIAGDRVLIIGASGGIGAIATQIAKRLGAHVTAVASASNEDFCRDLGADEFISYQNVNFAWSGQRWDLIFDAVGETSFREVLDVLNEGGRYVSTCPQATDTLVGYFASLFSKSGTTTLAQLSSQHLWDLIQLYEMGELWLPIDSHFAIRDLVDADRRLEDGKVRGKIVLMNQF